MRSGRERMISKKKMGKIMAEMSHAEEFKENGFTIARDFFKPEEIVWMIAETENVGDWGGDIVSKFLRW